MFSSWHRCCRSSIGRHIAGPSRAGIETDGPDGIAVLAAQEIPYDGFVIRGLDVDFAPNAAEPAEIIDDQIDARLAVRNDRRGPTRHGPPITNKL